MYFAFSAAFFPLFLLFVQWRVNHEYLRNDMVRYTIYIFLFPGSEPVFAFFANTNHDIDQGFLPHPG